jgi:hypothetical protein
MGRGLRLFPIQTSPLYYNKNSSMNMKNEPKPSLFDPSRDTVGKIYRDAQLASDGVPVIVGDMTNEMTKSLVDDLNEALTKDPYHGNPFYVVVHEKKDLQMKSAILRKIIHMSFRPWPEDDTVVFWKNPKSGEIRFCWCLPHWSNMNNVMYNPDYYEKEMVEQVKAWKEFRLDHFGFVKNEYDRWVPNPEFKDRTIV